jgi:lipopolysaccharide export system protein LptA
MKYLRAILPLALAALLAHPAAVTAQQQPARVIEVIYAATAEVTFTQGSQHGVLTGAELVYGDMRLKAATIEFDSQGEVVDLSGDVSLVSPEMELTAPRCRAELSAGVITAPEGITLTNKVQHVTASGNNGKVLLDNATFEPVSAELTGNAQVRWEEGLQLDGQQMQYSFADRLCSLTDGFIATVASSLLSSSFAGVAGGGLTMTGSKAYVKVEEGDVRRLLLTALEVQVSSPRMAIAGPNLAANLSAAKDQNASLEQALFMVTGTPGLPVSGWLLDSTGSCINFSALSLVKQIGSTELLLSGNVEISSNDFSLKADSVVATPEGDGVRINVPQRFRVNMSPELFKQDEGAAGQQPTG